METFRERWKTCINLIKKRQIIAVFIGEVIDVMRYCSWSWSNNSLYSRLMYIIVSFQHINERTAKIKPRRNRTISLYIKDISFIFCDNIVKSHRNRYWHWCKRLLKWKSNKGLSLFGRHHHQEINILGEVQLEEFLFVSG